MALWRWWVAWCLELSTVLDICVWGHRVQVSTWLRLLYWELLLIWRRRWFLKKRNRQLWDRLCHFYVECRTNLMKEKKRKEIYDILFLTFNLKDKKWEFLVTKEWHFSCNSIFFKKKLFLYTFLTKLVMSFYVILFIIFLNLGVDSPKKKIDMIWLYVTCYL